MNDCENCKRWYDCTISENREFCKEPDNCKNKIPLGKLKLTYYRTLKMLDMIIVCMGFIKWIAYHFFKGNREKMQSEIGWLKFFWNNDGQKLKKDKED